MYTGGRVKNLMIGVGVGGAVFLASMWYGATPLAIAIFGDTHTPALTKCRLVGNLLTGVFTDSSAAETLYLMLTAFFIGLNVYLWLELARLRRPDAKSSRGIFGLLGGTAAILGIGCAACGSLLAGFALGAFGIGSIISALPFGGQEVRFAGVIFLGLSAFLFWRDIKNPAICPV